MKQTRLNLIASAVAIGVLAASPWAHAQSVDAETVVIGLPQDITDLNPLNSIEIFDQTIVGQNMFDMHFDMDRETFETGPHVFTEWLSNESATEWTIKIRDDITFHNGDKLTAEDVKFSIEYMLSPESGLSYAYEWENITEIEVTGPYELKLRSDVPTPQQITISELFVLPKDYYQKVGAEGFAEAPVGSGPYKFVEWKRGESLEMVANEDYWGGVPTIKHIIFRVLPDETSRGSSYRAGELDIGIDISLEQFREIKAMNDPALGTISVDQGRMYFILDTHRAPFDDVRARKAFNHAIDVDTIIEQLMDGLPTRTAAILGPSEWGHNPDLVPYEYDPEKARQLLAEAGYPDGVDIEFWARSGYIAIDQVAQAIKPYLDAVGFRTKLSVMNRADMQKVFEDARDQMVDGVPLPIVAHANATGWGGNPVGIGIEFYQARATCDVERFNYPWGGFSCHPETARLEQEALDLWATDFDAAERKVMEMERNTYETAGFGFGWMTPRIWAKDKRLNFVLTPFVSLNMFHASWQQ
jgi:peptide/nickel transport system substrate-binding protein